MGPRLPGRGTTARTGDFGEIIAAGLYGQRLGEQVPFQKLLPKPVGGATQQGPDLLALTLVAGDEPAPVIVEVKTRRSISPRGLLPEIAANLARSDDGYLESAWAAGVQLMENHPAVKKAFALSAAQHLARLVDPTGSYPPHRRHAVVVTERDNLTVERINEHWAECPPVSELHVVTIANLELTVNGLYDAAAGLTYVDLVASAPHLLRHQAHQPGLTGAVSSDEPVALAARVAPGSPLAVCEAALWLLADWDGMGIARARAVEKAAPDPQVRGLAALLAGAAGRATDTLRDTPLAEFAHLITSAWNRTIRAEDVAARTLAIAGQISSPDLSQAVSYVGSAVAHRLPRHPVTLTLAAGATGRHVQHVVNWMRRIGRQALWPSQAAALSGGLLDRGYPSLAIKMPTSAGKTALIQLLVADALDLPGEPTVAVLAPTKALVSQLTGDLRQALPGTVPVSSSHGGLDYDTETPATAASLGGEGVAVMTPERFDLEWRRAVTGDGPATIDTLRLLVVDEAHLLAESGRGARLELAIGRALRHGIRVVLTSSQFPDLAPLACWLDGRAIESEWGPTWLRRYVYYRDATGQAGLRRGEAEPVEQLFPLKPSARSRGDGCPRDRPAEAAWLADREAGDGLVVIYTNWKVRIGNLVTAVEAQFGDWPGADEPLLKLAAGVEAVDGRAAALLRAGIGVHHGDVPRNARQAVETAARRGLLRCVVCTPTLLEGVDFPTRTVIAAYPPQTTGGVPQVGRLQNLAGRAGRGGRFTSGTLIVMAGNEDQARKWLRAFREQLPPTRSALTVAMAELRTAADARHLLDTTNPLAADDVDAVLLAAIAEGAAVDGDLRATLEDALGRTLWYATTHPSLRDYILQLAAQRARYVVQAVGDARWRGPFYRSGLPLSSCLQVRDGLAPYADQIATGLRDPWTDWDEMLIWLAVAIAPHARVLAHWAQQPPDTVQALLHCWLSGEPMDDLADTHADVWSTVEPGLDTLLPWVLTAAVEFTATQLGDPDLRDVAHRRLEIARLRYGVPRGDLCEVVRAGYDRVLATQLARQYDQEPPEVHVWQTMPEYVAGRAQSVLDISEAGQADEDVAPEPGPVTG